MSKELEALERIVGCSTIESHRPKWQEDYKIVETALKALEIIKEKTQIGVVILGDKPKIRITYNGTLRFYDITQEEYELLKEVLL